MIEMSILKVVLELDLAENKCPVPVFTPEIVNWKPALYY